MPTQRPKIRQAVSLQSKGIKELTGQLRAMRDVAASVKVAAMLGDAAQLYIQQARANMRAQGWPHEVQEAGFVDRRWPHARRGKNRISVLFGIRKRGRKITGSLGGRGSRTGVTYQASQWAPGYVEWWGAGQGRIVGENIATMFEFGTSKMPPRPALVPALLTVRPRIRAHVKTELPNILHEAKERIGGLNG